MFSSSKGIFKDVYTGQLTRIVAKFNKKMADPGNENTILQSKNEILAQLSEKDELGRTPFDIACFLGFKNVALYLLSKMGTP